MDTNQRELHGRPAAFLGGYFLLLIAAGMSLLQSPVEAAADVELVTDQLRVPVGLALDMRQRLFVADAEQGAIYRLSVTGQMLLEAEGFAGPRDFAFDQHGNLLVTDTTAGKLYRLDTQGHTTILAEGLAGVCCVAVDGTGSVFVLHDEGAAVKGDAAPTMTVSRVATDGGLTAIATGFQDARGMVIMATGDLIVAAAGCRLQTETHPLPLQGGEFRTVSPPAEGPGVGAGLFQVTPSGAVSRLLDLGSITPSGLTLSSQGTLFFAGMRENAGAVFITSRGTFEALATGFTAPHGLAAAKQDVFVADGAAGEIWRIRLKETTDDTNGEAAGTAATTTSSVASAVPAEEELMTSIDREGEKLRLNTAGLNRWGYAGFPDYAQIPVTPAGFPQAPAGVTCVIGRVLHTEDDAPFANATVRLGLKAIRTNSQGYFLLVDVPAGQQVILLDGRSADVGDVHYPIAMEAVELAVNSANVLPFINYFPILDTAHAVPVDPQHKTVLTSPLLPDVEIHVPKGTEITSVDGTPVTELSVTFVPPDKPMYPMNLVPDFGNHITIQPGGAVCSKPVKVIYNNPSQFPPGTRVQLWKNAALDHGGWFNYGMGAVSEDGRQIVPDNNAGIQTLGCGVAPRTPPPPGGGGGDDGGGGGGSGGAGGCQGPECSDCEAKPVVPSTGVVWERMTDLAVPGLLPMALQRTYRSQDNNVYAFGLGMLHSYEAKLYGSPNGAPGSYLDYADSSDTSYRFSYQTNFPARTYVCTNDYRWAGAKIYQVQSGGYPTYDGWNYFMVLKGGAKHDFDGLGFLRAIRDANNNTLQVDRGTAVGGNVQRIVQPSGRYVSFTYNGSRVARVTDSAGRSVSYVYDGSNRLIESTNVVGGVTRFYYDAANNMTNMTLPNGVVWMQNLFDSANRVTNQIVADGGRYTFSYTTNATTGAVATSLTTRPLGSTATRAYATTFLSGNSVAAQYITNTVNSIGNTNRVFRDAATMAVTSGIDPLGRTSSTVYDANFNVVAVTNALGKVTTFTYESTYNKVTRVIDPLGHTTSFAYDGYGNLTSITNALGKVTTITYNSFGQPLTVTDPLANTHTFTYNSMFDLETVTDPLGNSVRRVVDELGRPVALIDSFGRTTKITYSDQAGGCGSCGGGGADLPAMIEDPLAGVTHFAYDIVGNLTNVTDALDHAVGYAYDSENRLTARTDQLGQQEIYRYDKSGNVTNFVDRRGVSINFQYDVLDRRTGVVYAAGDTVGYFYDKVGRATSVVDSVSGAINLSYDGLDRLTQEVNNQGTVTYTYNDVGLRTALSVAGNQSVTYLYDAANRLTNTVAAAGGSGTASLFYDDAGRRTKLTLPNGINVLYSYDAGSRLTNITYQAAVTNSIAYAYDSVGNRVAQASSLSLYNLPAAVTNSGYNAANQQLTFGSYAMLYDAAGNVTNIFDGAVNQALRWNSRNQLTNVAAAVSAAFGYDGLGRRQQRTVSGTTVNYLYDGLDAIVEKDGSGIVQARYLRGLGIDEPWQRGEVSYVYEGGTTTGLRGWWKLNEGTGTTAADASGNANTATLTGGPTWTTGVASNAVNLDGVNDYLSVGDKATLEGNATFTFAAWVNPDTFPAGRDTYLFYKQNALIWGFLSASNRRVTVNIATGGNNSYQGATTSTTDLNSNAWTHVTVTYTNSTVKFYVNGMLADTISKTYTMGSNNKAFSISTGSQSFDGKLDDLRYYNRALSDTEVSGIYGEQVTNKVYLADALGSTVALTGTNKAIQTSYAYEPFGRVTASGAASANAFTFTGRESEGGPLYYYRARYYHAGLHRFLSEDPIEYDGGDINLYGYVWADPISFTDPDGENPISVTLAVGWAAYKLIKWGGEGYYAGTSQMESAMAWRNAVKCAEANYGGNIPPDVAELLDSWQRNLVTEFGPAIAPALKAPHSTLGGGPVRPPSPSVQPAIQIGGLSRSPRVAPTPIYYPTREQNMGIDQCNPCGQ